MPQLLACSPEHFANEAQELLRNRSFTGGNTENRRFRAMFGTTPKVCPLIWDSLLREAPVRSKPKHLLWAILFLKVYASERINCALTGSDEKTFRKLVWIFVRLISDLRLDGRLAGSSDSAHKASVDGVDFMINEPTPFNPRWYSHKFRSAGLRYEVGVTIHTGNICWGFGPFPCGAYSDLKKVKLAMKKRLLRGEKVVADGGYKDSSTTFGTRKYAKGHSSYVRARHEAVNKRLKQFRVLGKRFVTVFTVTPTAFMQLLTLLTC